MPWIFFALAFACFGLAIMANLPFLLIVILLLAALGFILAAVMNILAARLESNSRDDSKIISPEELRMMREQTAARKADESQKNNAQ